MFKLKKFEDKYIVQTDTHLALGVGMFKKAEDGYFCFYPELNMNINGCWSAPALSELAFKLNHLNKEWDAQVRAELWRHDQERHEQEEN